MNAVDPNGTYTDWIQNKYGDYLWDDNATSQATTREGWKYIGKELPEGYDRSNILTEIDDRLYFKNSSNIFASIGNLIFGDGTFVNHKRYDPAEREFMQNALAASVGTVGVGVVKLGVNAIRGSVAKSATEVGVSDFQLLTKIAQKSEAAIGGSGRFAGTSKHIYANNLLNRYQRIYGSRGLESNQYFNKVTGKGFLDVVNHKTMTIYDYKFGGATMSKRQFMKYSTSFPGYSIQIIRPF